MEVNILLSTSSVEVNLLPTFHGSCGSCHGSKLLALTSSLLPFTSMEIGGNFLWRRSNGIRWTLMECVWKRLEVCDTRGK